MWEPSNLAEKKFNAESTRLIGEALLHQYGAFLEEYSRKTKKQKYSLKNAYNVSGQIISVQETILEYETSLLVVHSDNKILSRIIASLGSVCNEMILLIADAEMLYKYFVFYENTHTNAEEFAIAKIIEPLQQVHSFVMRVQQVMVLALKQLSSLLGKKMYVAGSSSAFPEVLNKFGDLMVCLLKFEELLNSRIMKDHWFLYRKSIKNMLYCNKLSPNVKHTKLSTFDKKLQRFENDLLLGHILKSTIDKFLEDKDFYYQMKNSSLNQEIHSFINSHISDLDREEEGMNPHLWYKLNLFIMLYFNIFENADKKLMKKVLDINKKYSAFTLIGNIIWYPEQFLLKHVINVQKFIDENAIENHRLNLINTKTLNFPRDTSILCLQVCYFLMDMEKISRVKTKDIKFRELQNILLSLTTGLHLARKISFSIKWILNLHIDKNLPLGKSVILAVCKLTELLKSILLIFRKNMLTLSYKILLTSQHLSHKALALLANIRKQFTQEKSYNERQLDVLSSLNMCEQALKRSATSQNLLIANLALSASGLYSSNLTEMRLVLQQIEMLTTISKTFEEVCDCFFLYWHQNYMLPIYFSKLLTTKTDLSRYYLILNAITDSFVPLDTQIVGVSGENIWEHFYKPLGQIIEVNLRLQTHLHLQLPQTDPFENYFSLNFNKYMPAPMGQEYKSIKQNAEHQLSITFYNLTSVVLHDWRTYGEMRRLAYLQYGIETVDDNLPMQTLEQGLDVLEIMRNINVFVNSYYYNLNSQVFIQSNSENKHLNSISISQVANSIRTHGIGIMNTTVNFTYQFLRSKFHIFSQFIYDEHIKSRLIKDLRYFSEHKDELNQMYPYQRAEKFNIGIRKLGLNENGESYLDLFRKVVTHIGNAMGYVRLIRSGGRRCLADGTCFIPDLKNNHLRDTIPNEDMPELSRKAATSLADNLQMFLDNIEDATEYFKLLVKVFVPVLRSKNNLHLKNFYVMIPPLTINFIEHTLNCKEKLNKRNRAEYIFTDDGFALGLAYIIEILNQGEQLNSLHWFHSVEKKFSTDRSKIKEQLSVGVNCDDKLKQALSLTEKKIALYEREFGLLYYSFNSAKLFFQS